MRCSSCGSPKSKVVRTSPKHKDRIVRRRECLCCGLRYTSAQLLPVILTDELFALSKTSAVAITGCT